MRFFSRRSRSAEQGSDYYDEHLDRVLLPLEESPWLQVYRQAADLLPDPSEAPRIADLGSGTGRLAKLLAERGYTHYWGVDFSQQRVAEARRYVPEFRFDHDDVFNESVRRRLSDFDTFVLLEILEHIDADRALLAALPGGASVAISVPNYPSASHVRHFRSARRAERRYKDLVDFRKWVTTDVGPDKQIFVGGGVRR